MRRASHVALALSLLGCGRLDDAMASAQLALDGTEAVTALGQAAYLGGVVFSSVKSQDAATAAAVTSLPDDLAPHGCAAWIVDAKDTHAATVAFDVCGGSYQLAKMTGGLHARFDQQPDGRLRAQIASGDFSTSHGPTDLLAVAVIQLGKASRSVDWHATWSAHTAGGLLISQTADVALVVDSGAGCRAVSGRATTLLDGRSIETRMNAFRLCTEPSGATVCPQGALVHRDPESGREVTVRFDGTDHVAVSSPDGDPYVVTLKCKQKKTL